MASLSVSGTKATPDFLLTYSGLEFHPTNIHPNEISILDISHALSNQCRYGGHCRTFYSVAQHSVLVSRVVQPKWALWGLLHDASEAFLVDMPRPVKGIPAIAEVYEALEAEVMKVICKKFGLNAEMPLNIKRADNAVLAAEMRDLMPRNVLFTEKQGIPEKITPWTPKQAERNFLRRFEELTH